MTVTAPLFRERFFTGMALAVLAAFALLIQTVAAAADMAAAEAKVEKLHAGLEHIMANGESLGYEGRVSYLRDVVEETYNLPGITAQSMGRAKLNTYDSTGRAQIEMAYLDFIVANYASRFSKPLPISFETLDAEETPRGATLVKTLLHREEGDPVRLDYLMAPGESGEPGIVDVFYNGVSEAARRRSEFASIGGDSYSAIVQVLQQKSDQIAADFD